MSKMKNLLNNVLLFFQKDLWDIDSKKGVLAYFIYIIRVLVTLILGVAKNKIAVQAASLSYATLLAIGPILAIIIMFSSMFISQKSEVIYEKISDAATFVMPAMKEMFANNDASQVNSLNPQISEFINTIANSKASLGTYGVAMMIVTCLLLCVNMESSFNSIWGIKKGRKWLDRFAFYFSMMFFGSVGLVSGMSFWASSHIEEVLVYIPFASQFSSWIMYGLGMTIITFILAYFYKAMPCTKVSFRSALIGAVLIVILLSLNNKLSFLYISYIANQQNIYGYFAIVAVVMFSLYLFWLILLIGGQITYAVEYVDFISNKQAWNNMSEHTKKIITLAIYAQISKGYYNKVDNVDLDYISKHIKLSKIIVISAYNLMKDKNIIALSQQIGDDYNKNESIKPALPPDTTTVKEFFDKLFSSNEDIDLEKYLAKENLIVKKVLENSEEFESMGVYAKTIKQLL